MMNFITNHVLIAQISFITYKLQNWVLLEHSGFPLRFRSNLSPSKIGKLNSGVGVGDGSNPGARVQVLHSALGGLSGE